MNFIGQFQLFENQKRTEILDSYNSLTRNGATLLCCHNQCRLYPKEITGTILKLSIDIFHYENKENPMFADIVLKMQIKRSFAHLCKPLPIYDFRSSVEFDPKEYLIAEGSPSLN